MGGGGAPSPFDDCRHGNQFLTSEERVKNKTKSLLDAIIKSFCNVLDKPVFITNC